MGSHRLDHIRGGGLGYIRSMANAALTELLLHKDFLRGVDDCSHHLAVWCFLRGSNLSPVRWTA
jgi:hypothetical protein